MKKGERGLLVGRTGSGKTQNAVFQMRHSVVSPVIILDTKIENAFFGLPEEDEKLDLIESIDDFKSMSKRPKKDLPEYILVRPEKEVIQNSELQDEYCNLLYHKFSSCFIYFDELYNWHKTGRTGDELIGLLTRGRSRGKTVLMSSQRPALISRFCVSETDKFYIHHLNDMRDRKTIGEFIPDFQKVQTPPKYHFWHYNVSESEQPTLYAPVPFQELNESKIFNKKWI
ncbi:MAG: hypothetical protein ACYDAO_09370 [Thermoplasmataceae archaeon]